MPSRSQPSINRERIPWRPILGGLIRQGFAGAVTMEIRYRHALDQADPWTVLADSYERLASFLDDIDVVNGVEDG